MPRACTSSRDKTECKHDFPKKLLINVKMRVICRGNARRFGLRVVGKRNMMWLPLNRRSCMWQSGTTPGFAAVFRTNAHTAPNYRVPPVAGFHDDELCGRTCLQGSEREELKARLQACAAGTA